MELSTASDPWAIEVWTDETGGEQILPGHTWVIGTDIIADVVYDIWVQATNVGHAALTLSVDEAGTNRPLPDYLLFTVTTEPAPE